MEGALSKIDTTILDNIIVGRVEPTSVRLKI